ncbi:MAG: CobW family GTP-binding protein [Prolixibacteraceae bacterium]
MSIPLYLITGFLGSGKTSFLKHFLEQYGRHGRIAVIQNEFSPVNIDGKEIGSLGDYRILEVNNGSAFCVCLLGSFIKSLASFIDEVKPEALIMEASGMSDPVSLGQILHAEPLKGKVYLAHVWSVVDVVNFHRGFMQGRIIHQLRIADTVILNKTDLSGGKMTIVRDEVRKINPFARLIPAVFAKVDVDDLAKALNMFPVCRPEETQSTAPELESVVIKTTREITEENLECFVGSIKASQIRCKGHVKVTGGAHVFLQGVYTEFSKQPAPGVTEPTELVVLHSRGQDLNLQTLFESYCI